MELDHQARWKTSLVICWWCASYATIHQVLMSRSPITYLLHSPDLQFKIIPPEQHLLLSGITSFLRQLQKRNRLLNPLQKRRPGNELLSTLYEIRPQNCPTIDFQRRRRVFAHMFSEKRVFKMGILEFYLWIIEQSQTNGVTSDIPAQHFNE